MSEVVVTSDKDYVPVDLRLGISSALEGGSEGGEELGGAKGELILAIATLDGRVGGVRTTVQLKVQLTDLGISIFLLQKRIKARYWSNEKAKKGEKVKGPPNPNSKLKPETLEKLYPQFNPTSNL